MSVTDVIIAISASILSGIGTALFSSIKESKRENARRIEREQEHLKLELKDLQLQLYRVEKDLDEWKNKYYLTIQELISVKSELEDTLIKLNNIDILNFES
jgi:peptidoglycan hydrolase CwlO-like protein